MKTTTQYRREYYEHVLVETFAQNYRDVCCLNEANGTLDPQGAAYVEIAKDVFKAEVLDRYKNETVNQIHERLMDTGSFLVRRMSEAALIMANEAVERIRAEKADVPEEVTLSDTEKEVLSAIYEGSNSSDNVEAITTSIANALFEEERKAKEVQEVIEMAKTQADGTKDTAEIISECVVDKPRSLMHAVITGITKSFINENAASISESNDLSGYLRQNKSKIHEFAKAQYALYESIQGFGWRRFTEGEIKHLCNMIYKV